MSKAVAQHALSRPVRIGLLGVAIGAAWLAVSLFTGGSSASATDDGADDSLLGQVSSGLTQSVDVVGGTVETVVESTPIPDIVEQVQQAAVPVEAPAEVPIEQSSPDPAPQAIAEPAPEPEPAPAPAPESAPAAQPLLQSVATTVVSAPAQVVETTADVAGAVVETTADVAGSVVTTAFHVVDAVELEAVVAPVSDVLDGVLTGIPVVSDLVEPLLGTAPTAGLLVPIVVGVDGAVDTVTGDGAFVKPVVPVDHGVPEDDVVEADGAATALTAPAQRLATSTAVPSNDRFAAWSASAVGPSDDAAASDGSAPDPEATPSAQYPTPTAPLSGSSSGSMTGAASGVSNVSDAITSASSHAAAASLALHARGDELPSSPIFATDSTPD